MIEPRKSWYYFSSDAKIGSKYPYGISALCRYINSNLGFTYSLDFNPTLDLISTLDQMQEKLDKIIQENQQSAILSKDLSIFLILREICENVYLELLGEDD